MRKKDREIQGKEELIQILQKADVARIALSAGGVPYIVAMNYGFEWADKLLIFFHCAKEGKKLEMMEQNNSVCFQMDTDHELIKGTHTCKWTMNFKSIVGFGMLGRAASPEERKKGLDLIMNHYGHEGEHEYNEKILDLTEVLKLEVTEITGKQKC